MDFRKIILGALIYTVWSVLIGYFVPSIGGWATIIAALTAGIYAGFRAKPENAFHNGLAAGLLGGIAGAIIINLYSSIAGIPLIVYPNEFLAPVFQFIEESFPWVTELTLIVIGAILGGMGAILGSKKKLGKVFLFFLLFLLFIFYGAIDNVAWNWGRTDWTWNMSISHVLTNQIDLFVAVVFAAVTTLLALVFL
jgi:hypothetical protein